MAHLLIAASGAIDTVSAGSFEKAVKSLGEKVLINNNPTWWLIDTIKTPKEIYSSVRASCESWPEHIHVFSVSANYPSLPHL